MKFHPFGNISQVLGTFKVLLEGTCQNFEPTLAKKIAIGHIFIVAHGQILQNKPPIWSH